MLMRKLVRNGGRPTAKKKTKTLYGKCFVILLCGLTSLVVFRGLPGMEPPKSSSSIAVRRHCAQHNGYIVANMHGRLANNLFQVAMANRLSQDLCWPIIYKEGWEGVLPHASRALQCFPNALGPHQRRPDSNVTEIGRTWFDVMKIKEATENTWTTPEQFYKEVPHRRYGETYEKWKKHSMKEGTSIRISPRGEFNYSSGWDNDLVEILRNPGNQTFEMWLEHKYHTRRYDTVRTIQLDGFYVHYGWIEPWMDRVRQWHQMDEAECCRHVPPENAVVVHVRNFLEEDELNPDYKLSVYFELLDRIYFNNSNNNPQEQYVLWIVCQPQDTEIELVQALHQRYNGTIVTGDDPYDAFCTLQKARNLVLSTRSTFSQMAALLATPETNVHYLLYELHEPGVTLVVPHWNYHLVELQNKDSIQTWNVNVSSIRPVMS